MKSYQVTELGQPLELVETDTPEPTGSQVLLKTIACGVCHSDVHLWHGGFDLGGGKFQWGDQTLLVQRGDVKGLGE